MAFDIKKKAEEIVKKIAQDESLRKDFSKEPIQVIEKLIGVDLPEEQIEKVAELVKAKIDLDQLSDLAGNLGNLKNIGSLGKLFGK